MAVVSSGTGTRPTFHAFAFHGDFVLHDVRSSQTVFTDQPTYEFLALVEGGSSTEEAVASLLPTYGSQVLDGVLHDLSFLQSQLGFFAAEQSGGDAERDHFSDTLLATHPRSMMLLVAQGCNLKCTYCYEVSNDWHSPGTRMTANDAEEAVDEFFRRAGPRPDLSITFFGGEPLLNFEVIRSTVAYANTEAARLGKNVGFTITTNATRFSEEVMDFLVEHEFSVMVSMDGDQESHDAYRVDLAGKGTHAKVEQSVKKLLAKQNAAGVRPLQIRATLARENLDGERAGNYFESLGNARIMIGSNHGTAFSKRGADITEDQLVGKSREEDERVVELVEQAVRGEDWPRWVAYPSMLKEIHEAIARQPVPARAVPKLCGVGRNMRAVTPKGEVFPCHRYVGMDAYKLRDEAQGDGDADEHAAVDGYYRKVFDAFESHCTKCWARYRCGGQCPWYLSKPDGELVDPDEPSCVGIRRGQERTLWLYLTLARRAPQFLAKLTQFPVGDLALCSAGTMNMD